MKKQTLIILLVVGICAVTSGLAQAPAWWTARGVLDTNQPVNDYAVVNLGQLKWMATNACAEMDAYFGAGTGVTTLISTICDPTHTDNYFLANIGQLKYVVHLFYDRLHELNLTNTFPANMTGYYPWGGTPNTNDYALAVIGQLKYIFSFDSAVDTDEDGLKDWEEVIYGTDPYNPDTDGDEISDGDEIAQGSNPLDPDSQDPEDLDALREAARARIVHNWQLVFGTTPAFTNTCGSQADLDDMRDKLNVLLEKNYKSVD